MKKAALSWIHLSGNPHDIVIAETDQAARAVGELKPDIVAFELCPNCHDLIIGQEDLEDDLKIHELLDSGNILLLLMQIFLTFSYGKIGDGRSVEPGSEMPNVIEAARKAGARLESLDGNGSAILQRFWIHMGFMDKLWLLGFMIRTKMGKQKAKIEKGSTLSEDAISQMIFDLTLISPAKADKLKRERDSYVAGKLFQLSRKGKVLAVIDTSHREWIKALLINPEFSAVQVRAETGKEPRREISWAKILGTAITMLVLGAMVLVIDNAQTNQNAMPAFFIWFAVTGGLSALGVILARGHPLSAFTALMVAWLTTLIPFIAAGLFAGAVEAWKLKPTVGDLKRLGQARSFDQMTKNRLFRVLLVTVLANLGGIVGMFLGIYIIWQWLGLINPADLLKGIL
jgi:pheromone shutdown-related protein TraB